MNLNTAVSPRKARNTRKNQDVVLVCFRFLSSGLQINIFKNIFVIFVFFVDELVFFG
jgi:hypothetical protein